MVPLRSAAHQHWLCSVGRGSVAQRGNPTLHLFNVDLSQEFTA